MSNTRTCELLTLTNVPSLKFSIECVINHEVNEQNNILVDRGGALPENNAFLFISTLLSPLYLNLFPLYFPLTDFNSNEAQRKLDIRESIHHFEY
ncbi:hypothetical protein POVCU2_0085650 [Plasmodium ovale curtisi]|uniref:Uncharacterized protein n=1 Tax=Plasmodium ovale curtisi TaxID=864141 RepID=A0A1A8WQC0_PLAOA|nr:hypothetical protein POVCU2_0085650 [Plasmodium ovale curtisi]